jgi:FKBP-type peptidyl-prolyl cis-trans isomerase SlyD
MVITKNRVVSIDYVLTDDEGQLIDSSEGLEPLAYLHGRGTMIPGLETELEGKNPGDKFMAVIAPEKAYGIRDEKLVMDFPRSNFETDTLEPGMQFEASDDHGYRIFTVKAVDGDTVKVDANHPLAGETLHFQVEVVDVREASAEEIEHGHIHGEECGDCEDCGDKEEGCGCGCGCAD